MPLPTTGLVFWVKGDVGLEFTPGSPDVSTAWRDQSGFGQDLDVTPTHGGSIAPYTGLDSIDGIPCISFPAGATESWLARAQNMIDRSSSPITTGPRTVMAVMLPKSGAFNVTGGPVLTFQQQSPEITCLFDTESNVDPNGAYAFAKRWRGDIGSACQFTPVLGGPGGTYDGVPTLAEWQFGVSPAVAFLINNVLTAVTPPTRAVGSAVSETGFIVGCGAQLLEFSYMGALAEIAVWDYDLDTDPAAHAEAVGYFAGRYPSLSIALPLTLNPTSALVTPGGPTGKVSFVASGGTPAYTYSILTNRSGGSIDPTTGQYVAGPHGLVQDIVRVTDSAAAHVDAVVSVSTGLYQHAHRTIPPPFLKQPNGLLIEGNYGAEKDWQWERTRQALLSNLLTDGPGDALDFSGAERQLPRAQLLDGTPNETDANFRARLRVSWTDDHGNYPRGSHEAVLFALDRAGFPQGDPDGAHIMQKYVRYSWLSASGGTPVYGSHPPWMFDSDPQNQCNKWGIIFGADVPELDVGTPAADAINRIAAEWGPAKGVFMGTWIVVSGPTWGWPVGVAWGAMGRNWGGGVTRFVSPA